jgi:two-component system, NtrC family, response regulator AtoC
MPAELVQSFHIDAADLPSESVIFGGTAAMREVCAQIERILDNDLPVLIRGESGTGKEVVAKFLHARSSRRDAPFVKVNCAAIPASLLESELLGYEAGSFNGAREAKPGMVEIAAGGSLFLDEIGDMDWALQTKLLHLIEDGHYFRVGGGQERLARVRIICATNTDLEKAVERRAFREDLFYRIEVINLRLLPLRERKQDIPLLCEHFLEKLARRFDRRVPPLSPGAMHLLKQWSWPGNLRELENCMGRVVILGDECALGAELGRQLAHGRTEDNLPARNGHLKDASRQAASTAARTVILKVLQANRWNRRKTAEDLNMSYRSLLYKLREAGVPQRRKNHKGLPPNNEI